MIVIRMPIVLAISWGVTGRKETAASPPILTVANGEAELGQDGAGAFGEVHEAAAVDEDVSVVPNGHTGDPADHWRGTFSQLGIGPSRSRGTVHYHPT
jgi:hypothetical protein